MQKMVREIIGCIRNAGGSEITISQGGRHVRLEFKTAEGRKTFMLVHRGSVNRTTYLTMVRRRLRQEGMI